MNLKDQFSLLIPTYNRYPYLLRLLKYYKSFQFPFKIYILDSSDDEMQSEDLKQLLAEDSIYYQKYDSSVFFPNKIAMGCEYVTTPYAALCADDDFIVPSGIEESINFLRNALDYTLAHGRYVFHSLDSPQNNVVWKPGYLNDKTLSLDNTIERINTHVLNYSSTFYAVHRSKIMKLIWNETAIYATSFGFSEIFPSVLSVLYGKLKILDVLYSSREQNSYSWYDSDFHNVMYSMEKLTKAATGLAIHISKKEGLSFDASNILARKCLEQYTTPLFKNSAKRKFILYKVAKFVFRLPLLHFFLKSFINYEPLQRVNIYKNKINYLYKLKNFRREFIAIKEAVLNSRIDTDILNKTRRTYMNFVKDD